MWTWKISSICIYFIVLYQGLFSFFLKKGKMEKKEEFENSTFYFFAFYPFKTLFRVPT